MVGQFFEIMQRITDSAFLLEGIIRNLEVDVPRALEVVRNGFSTVTDLADEMVRSMGLSFAAAKKIVGRLVVIAHDEGIACTKIDTALVARAAKEVLDIDLNMPQELITNALDPVQNVTRLRHHRRPQPRTGAGDHRQRSGTGGAAEGVASGRGVPSAIGGGHTGVHGRGRCPRLKRLSLSPHIRQERRALCTLSVRGAPALTGKTDAATPSPHDPMTGGN